MTITEKIENIVKKLKTRKSKNIIYCLVVGALVLVFGYRFYVVARERGTDVFNITRNNIENGTPVEILTMSETDGVLYEPITIKNNRAYVSGARINTFKVGQKIGDCKIVSVSHNIDLDTGMHVIKTDKCSNGLQYVEIAKRGLYVPISAVRGNSVYVVDSGVARSRDIIISGRDLQNVLVKSGLQNGDVVILSDVKDGEKIKIIK